jgi:DNA modification methylase/plasmid maintenance system antidote protein VapI
VIKVKLDEINLDEDIYPRKTFSHKTVEHYVEALKGGAVFPPIVVQKVRDNDGNGKEKLICIDGWHRVTAYREYYKDKDNGNAKDATVVDAILWKDTILDKNECLEELRIESARMNLKHGYRLSQEDLRYQLLKIVKERPIERLEGIVTELARAFGYDASYISKLIGEEVRRRKVTRDAQILRLHLLGWRQEEIADVFGVNQSTVSRIMQNLTSQILHIQEQFYDKHKQVEEIAEFYGLDITTAWSIILQGKSDLERFSIFGKSEYQDDAPMLYNVWNFAKNDPRLGYDYAGRIPGQIVMNLLYYYTEQGELVIDPMAGSGTTVDACLIMNRRCRAYDIAPTTARKDIKQLDLNNGLPDEAMNCDLIILDPPYWDLLKRLYAKESVSSLDLKGWLEFMQKASINCYNALKEGGEVALIIGMKDDTTNNTANDTNRFYDLPYYCMKLFESAGFKEVQRISIPLTTQVKSHHDVEYAKRNRIMLNINRDLIVYRK